MGGAQKHISRTILFLEEVKVIKLLSCFLEVFSQALKLLLMWMCSNIHLCFLKLDLQRGHHSSLTLTRGPGLGALISHLLQPLSRLPALALFGTAFTSTEATWNTLTFFKFVRQGLTVYSPWLARNHFVDQAGLGQQSVHECVSLCVHRPRAGGGQRRV